MIVSRNLSWICTCLEISGMDLTVPRQKEHNNMYLAIEKLLDLLDLLELLEFVISNYSSSRTCSFSPFSFVIVMADIVFVRVSFCKSDWSLSFISLKAA